MQFHVNADVKQLEIMFLHHWPVTAIDCYLRQSNSRFTNLASQAVLALNIVPVHVEHNTIQTINSIYDRFGTVLDSTKTSFEQEATLWKTHWT